MSDNHNLKITTNWRPATAGPSHLWRKLWARLVANKKGTPPATHEASDKKYEDEDDKTRR